MSPDVETLVPFDPGVLQKPVPVQPHRVAFDVRDLCRAMRDSSHFEFRGGLGTLVDNGLTSAGFEQQIFGLAGIRGQEPLQVCPDHGPHSAMALDPGFAAGRS